MSENKNNFPLIVLTVKASKCDKYRNVAINHLENSEKIIHKIIEVIKIISVECTFLYAKQSITMTFIKIFLKVILILETLFTTESNNF